MTTQTKPHPLSAVEPYRFTIPQYHAMAEVGILRKEDRVELIDGVILAMAPIGNRHLVTVDRFASMLFGAVAGRAIVRVQGSITLDDHTMPEPDLALLKWQDDFYESRPAGPEDVLLLIEVSDSSVGYDRGEKLALYARAGIPEIWLAVLPERIVEAHTRPAGGRYTHKRIFTPGDTLTPSCFPDIAIPVGQIVPG